MPMKRLFEVVGPNGPLKPQEFFPNKMDAKDYRDECIAATKDKTPCFKIVLGPDHDRYGDRAAKAKRVMGVKK